MSPGKQSTWGSGAWHPDTRASLAGAVAAALLVMAAFFALFSASPKLKLSRDAQIPTQRLVLAEPRPDLPPPIPRAHVARPALPVELPQLERMAPPALAPVMGPGSFGLEDYLDERTKGNAAALRDQVTGSELKRDLGKRTEKPAISDNQSYRTIDGQKVERSGGGCAESQTQQGSSSPTNHFEVARPISCPGGTPDASQQMGKALDDWAKKVRQSQPPPP